MNEKLSESIGRLQKMIDEMEKWDDEVCDFENYIQKECDNLDARLMVAPDGITVFVCPTQLKELNPLFSFIREIGYRLEKKPTDLGESRVRIWNFIFDNLAPVSVFAHLSQNAGKSGEACRFVQIGVEEKPVYKVICGSFKDEVEGDLSNA